MSRMKKTLCFLVNILSGLVGLSAQEPVDLGLSVKWASCNLGASRPEKYGNYYAWGETRTKWYYDWETYKWCVRVFDRLTKYNFDEHYGRVDNKQTLEAADDAARVKWGGAWRMPTVDELRELIADCTWEWTVLNKVNGYKVSGKKPGYTDRWIFIPCAGSRQGFHLEYDTQICELWTASLDTEQFGAFALSAGEAVKCLTSSRRLGCPIRPVTD